MIAVFGHSVPMLLLSLLALIGCTHRPVVVAVPGSLPEVQVPGSVLEFYEISGSNPVDVVESLVTVSPAVGNIHHAAQTRWEVVWRYPAGPDDRPDQCDLSTVDVKVSIVTDFPRWTPGVEADDSDVREWQRYTRALAVHEAEHVRLIEELAGTLPAVLGGSDCANADARGQAVLDAIREANTQLDVVTRDGATQGAALAWLGA